jgi:hypothetical protein
MNIIRDWINIEIKKYKLEQLLTFIVLMLILVKGFASKYVSNDIDIIGKNFAKIELFAPVLKIAFFVLFFLSILSAVGSIFVMFIHGIIEKAEFKFREFTSYEDFFSNKIWPYFVGLKTVNVSATSWLVLLFSYYYVFSYEQVKILYDSFLSNLNNGNIILTIFIIFYFPFLFYSSCMLIMKTLKNFFYYYPGYKRE